MQNTGKLLFMAQVIFWKDKKEARRLLHNHLVTCPQLMMEDWKDTVMGQKIEEEGSDLEPYCCKGRSPGKYEWCCWPLTKRTPIDQYSNNLPQWQNYVDWIIIASKLQWCRACYEQLCLKHPSWGVKRIGDSSLGCPKWQVIVCCRCQPAILSTQPWSKVMISRKYKMYLLTVTIYSYARNTTKIW